MMLPENFKDSLQQLQPPSEMSVYLQALWYDAKKNWEKAHELIQDIHNENAAWIHGYLHRKEGDLMNARYWYGKARKPMPEMISLQNEWKQLFEYFAGTKAL